MERLDRPNGPRIGLHSMWRNGSVRRLAWTMVILAVVSCALATLYSHYAAEQLKREWFEKEYAIAGTLSQSDPASAERWLRALASSSSPSAETIETGKRWMAEHGMTEALDKRWLPVVGRFHERTLTALLAGSLLLVALLAAWLLRESRSELKTLRKLSVALEGTVKHNLPMADRLYGEGELGLLANGVQELSQRLRETIEQLHRDKAFLKDTVADISHQLKTPLASLIIYIDLLADGKADPSNAAEFIETCKRELDRMEWLILTLLKLARIEADALELNGAPGPIGETVRASVASVRRLAEERQVSIDVAQRDDDPGPTLPHDAHWLAEAMTNMLKNAVEASPPGSAVSVSWERTPVFVRVKIADQGPGIPDEHLPHIFKKFYRSSSGGSGVGLGLPLAKSIVEKHGGVLSAANSPEGGAVFLLTLPLQPLPLGADPSYLTNL